MIRNCQHVLHVTTSRGPEIYDCQAASDRDGPHTGKHYHETESGDIVRWADAFSAEIPAEPIS